MKLLINNSRIEEVTKETKVLYVTKSSRFKKEPWDGKLRGFGNDDYAIFITEQEERIFLKKQRVRDKKNEMVRVIYKSIINESILYKHPLNDIQVIYDHLVKMGIIKSN